MATSPRVHMRAVRNLYGTLIPVQEFKEAADCAFSIGAPVVLTSGYIDECGADPALILGLARKAGQDGTAAGDKSNLVEMAAPGVLFMGNLSNAGDTAVTAQTSIGAVYGIAKHSSSGKWYVDDGDTSADRVVIWDFWLQDSEVIGDLRGRVVFAFDPTYFQGWTVD
jgi:hypothetical protein